MIEFIPFTGTVEELPKDYKVFVCKFIDFQGETEYHIVTRLQDDLYQIGAVFHFDFDWAEFVGYKGIE